MSKSPRTPTRTKRPTPSFPQFNNSGTLALSDDFSYVNAGGTGLPQFNNTGTVNLSSGADFTLTSAILNNNATINFTNGSVTVGGSSIGTTTHVHSGPLQRSNP